MAVADMEDRELMALAQIESDLFADYARARIAAGARPSALAFGVIGNSCEQLGKMARAGKDSVAAKAYVLDFVAINFEDPETTQDNPDIIEAIRRAAGGDE